MMAAEGGRPLFGPPVPMPRRAEAARATRAAAPDLFATEAAARGFLAQILLPPSLRWGFVSVGKNASSSTLALLFRAEFGCELSVSLMPEHDINPVAALHMLADNRVFSRALLRGLSLADLLGPDGPGERICLVRDPMARAVSGFRYFCLSDARRSLWFAPDRLRINAAFGFDWTRHPGTAEGLELFLRYIARQIAQIGADGVDAHWRPQVDFIKPAAFRPTLTGRVEDMPAYYRALSDRLGFALTGAGPWENRLVSEDDPLIGQAAARTLCERVYAADYEAFGY